MTTQASLRNVCVLVPARQTVESVYPVLCGERNGVFFFFLLFFSPSLSTSSAPVLFSPTCNPLANQLVKFAGRRPARWPTHSAISPSGRPCGRVAGRLDLAVVGGGWGAAPVCPPACLPVCPPARLPACRPAARACPCARARARARHDEFN